MTVTGVVGATTLPDAPSVDAVTAVNASPVRHRFGLVAANLRGLAAASGGRVRDALLTELFLKRSPY